jgi:hypothetical protein
MPALWTFFSHADTTPWTALLILAAFASVFSALSGGSSEGGAHGDVGGGDVDFSGGGDIGVHSGGDVHVGDIHAGGDLHAGDVHAGDSHGGGGDGHQHHGMGDNVLSTIGLGALGRLPLALTMGLMALLTSSSSLVVQWIAWRYSGQMPVWWLAGLGGAAVTWSMLKISSPALDMLLPRNHTEALGWDDMIGLEGEIVLGVARIGLPAEARVRDSFGRDHYLLVEPRSGAPDLAAGTRVTILVHKDGKHFLAVEAVSDSRAAPTKIPGAVAAVSSASTASAPASASSALPPASPSRQPPAAQ